MSTNPVPLASIADYETFIYGLPDAFACIQMSTLVVVHTGSVTAVVRGEVHFGQGLVLRVLEIVNARQQRIERSGLRFDSPNLPFLIREIEQAYQGT